MQFFNSLSIATALSLAASTAWSAPISIKNTDGVIKMFEAFEGKINAPYCKLERKSTTMPAPLGGYSTAFTEAEADLDISRVLFGHGTQNYTCASSTAADKPVANGAKAVLIDISCFIKSNPELAHKIPAEYMAGKRYFLNGLISSFQLAGEHIFPDATTPKFTFNSGFKDTVFIGKKKEAVPCPAEENLGDNGTVDWLNLDIKEQAKGFKRAYRVKTSGGKPPATCAGQKASFEVPYATEYWFWSSKKDIK